MFPVCHFRQALPEEIKILPDYYHLFQWQVW